MSPKLSDRGSALIAVVWTVLLVSTLLAVALLNMRVESRLAIGRIESLKADAAARSGLAWAAFQFSKSSNRPAQNKFTLELGDYDLDVIVEKESGKVDINKAPSALLNALALSSGATDTQARDFTTSLLHARNRNLSGQEGIRSPIVDVAQLSGVSSTMRDCILGNLTVYTGSSGVDPSKASDIVREAQKRLGLAAEARRSRRVSNVFFGAAKLKVTVSRNGTLLSRVSRAVRVTPRSGLSGITQTTSHSGSGKSACTGAEMEKN